MNKKALILVSLALLLSACSGANQAVTNTSKEDVSPSSNTTLQSSSSQGEESSTNAESSEVIPSSEIESSEEIDSSESETSVEESSEPAELNTETETFVFEGSSTRQNLNGGANLSDANPAAAFKALFGDYLTSFNSDGVTFQFVGREDDQTTSLCIGTAKKAGELELTFNVPIIKISFELENYYKKYTSQGVEGVSHDPNSQLTVTLGNNEVAKDYDLGVNEYEQVVVTDELNMPSNQYTSVVKFSNDDSKQRVYVHNLAITYVVE